MSGAVESLHLSILSAENNFNSVLTNKSVSFQKEAEFAIQILLKSDYAKDIALKNQQSVIDSIVNLGAMGLSLNPASKQAYLVPRGGKTPMIVLEISYIGYCDLATESGSIEWVKANNVFEKDELILNGFDKEPTFKYSPFSSARGAFVGTFVVAKTASGAFLTETMSADEINQIKLRSESVKAGRSSPWTTDEGEMRKKTVIKRAAKMWPKSERLNLAMQYSNTTGEGIDFALPPAQLVAPEKPELSDEKFLAMEDKLMTSTKSAEDLIAMLECKYLLSEEQKTSTKMLKQQPIEQQKGAA